MNFSFITLFFIITLLPLSAMANKPLEISKKSFIEVQRAQVKTTDLAREAGEPSESEVQQTIYGQVGFDLSLWDHSIDSNVYFRQSQSILIEENSNATAFSLYPRRTIARDLFQLEHINETGDDRTEVALNKFTYDWGDDEVWFTFGRMHISYGEGVFSNPINPFNYNAGLANTYGINLASDGMEFLLGKKDKLKLRIYLLADRSFDDYEGDKVARTIFLRGDLEMDAKTNLTYVLGEDQKRHKYGVELVHQMAPNRKGYLQAMRYSQRLDTEDTYAEGLFHYLVGYQIDANTRQAFTFEFGKQQKNSLDESYDTINHLPVEAFAAASSRLSHSDKWSTELGLIQDFDSSYRFYKISSIYNMGQFAHIRFFHSAPIGEASEENQYQRQRFVPSETGIALRAHF